MKEQIINTMLTNKPMYLNLIRSFVPYEYIQDVFNDIIVHFLSKQEINYNPGKASLKTFVYTSIRNYLIDEQRREKRRGEQVEVEVVDEYKWDSDDPETCMIKQQTHDILNKKVNGLKDKYRIPITLHYDEGLSYNEIVEKLGISMTCLKLRMFRARNIIKQNILCN